MLWNSLELDIQDSAHLINEDMVFRIVKPPGKCLAVKDGVVLEVVGLLVVDDFSLLLPVPPDRGCSF